MSNLSEQAMAVAITELLKNRSLDKITIRDITDACGLTRNTFYYHFHDVYDLLRWLFEEKTRQIVERYQADEDWEGGLEETLEYMYENRRMMVHIQESISYDLLFRFINDLMYRHAMVIVTQIVKGQKFSDYAIRVAASFYMHAAVGDVMAWIRNGMDRTPEHMAQVYDTLFRGTVNAVLESAEKAEKIG